MNIVGYSIGTVVVVCVVYLVIPSHKPAPGLSPREMALQQINRANKADRLPLVGSVMPLRGSIPE